MNDGPLPAVFFTALAIGVVGLLAFSIALWRHVVFLRAGGEKQLRELNENHKQDLERAVNAERERGAEALRQAEQRFEHSLEQQKSSALSVVVHPFVNTEGQKGVFTRETKVEIGYKYQLFVQGLPCFEPHTMVLESTTHKEVDQQMLELLKKKAEQAAEAAIMVKGGGAARTAITIAKTAMKLVR